jgi:hypothetical protein
MQRYIRISSFAGLNIFNAQKTFRHFYMLKVNPNFGFSRISSALFNSNHSHYQSDTVYQNYYEKVDSNAVSLYFGSTIKQSLI